MRSPGIGPGSPAWKADILPIDYKRVFMRINVDISMYIEKILNTPYMIFSSSNVLHPLE